jgi:hypothetical protein
MRRRFEVAAGLIVAVGTVASHASAVDYDVVKETGRHVFRIVATGCADEPRDRALTGFRVEHQPGIFTALHGVLDCNSIYASRSEQGPTHYGSLRISQVNITMDVALLTSKELDEAEPSGIARYESLVVPKPKPGDEIAVIGYPEQRLVQKVTPLRVSSPTALVRLSQIINGSTAFFALRDRGSPAIDVDFLGVDGALQPGHSGAPIIDASGKLIGIALGGSNGPRSDTGWAAFYYDLELEPFDPVALARLRAHPVALAFGSMVRPVDLQAPVVPSSPVWATWVAAGSALVSGGLGSVLYLNARSTWNRAKAECTLQPSPGVCAPDSDGPRLSRKAKRLGDWATVFTAAAVVSGGLGVYFYLRDGIWVESESPNDPYSTMPLDFAVAAESAQVIFTSAF